jgi:tetratricopeptide (TPR) repeat protein
VPPPPRRPSSGDGRPARRDNTSRGSRPQHRGEGRPARPGTGRDADPRRPRREDDRPRPQREEDPRRPRLREPGLPDDISPRDLDRDARAELRSLPASLADKVAAHLIAAGRIIDDDPVRAREHAWYARHLAPRLAVTREAAGITAYRSGDYAAALAELRAVRRMTGDPTHLPVMADAERGLGRPDRALALARDPDVRRLDTASRVEIGIVASGARRDRGEFEAAVVGLQGAALDSTQLQPWTPRLWYAYADALLDAGRREEALRWFESVAAIDDEGETDADERIQALSTPG